jgi:hypothetical protein
MDQRQIAKQGVAALVARQARNRRDKTMKLAIVRYRHLKSLSERAADASQRTKLYERALMCLANSAENEDAFALNSSAPVPA